jgi:hypothetical protein
VRYLEATKIVIKEADRQEETKQAEGREKKLPAKKKSISSSINVKAEEKTSEVGKKMNMDLKSKREEEISKSPATTPRVTKRLSGKMEKEADGKSNTIAKRKSLTKLGLRFQNKKDSSKESLTKKLLNNSSGFLGNQNVSKQLQKKSSLVLLSKMDSQHRKSSATLSNQPLSQKKTSFQVFQSGSRKLFNSRRKINKEPQSVKNV